MATRRVAEAVAPEGGLARAVDFDMEAAWGRRAGGTMTMFPRFLPSPARPIRWQSVSVGASRAVRVGPRGAVEGRPGRRDRKSTRLNSSHITISYAVFCLKKK